MPATSTESLWQQTVGLIQAQGAASGLSQDQINAAIAVARAEGGYTGIAGDGGTSFGVFQFHLGGMLDAFASYLGKSIDVAKATAIEQPAAAIDFALGPGGYLADAIRQGSAKGYSGPDLAAYAEQYGQKSALPGWQAAADWWTKLFGGTTVVSPIPAGVPAPAPATAQTTVQVPAKSDLPIVGPVIDAINFAGASIQAAVLSLERFLWIILGTLLILIGLWLLVQAERNARGGGE